MGKIFDFDARKGSYADNACDAVATAFAVPFSKREKGLAVTFDAATSYIDYNGHDDLTGDITVEAWINAHGVGEGGAGRIVDNNGLIVSLTSPFNKQVFVSSDAGGTWKYSANDAWVTDQWLHLIVTRTVAGLTNIYVNNVITGTADETSGTPIVGFNNLSVGNGWHHGSTFNGMMYKVSISNHIYSSAERSAAYNRYLYSYTLGKENHPQYVRKPLDLSRESENGLLVAYNMVPSSSALVDISGNLNDATIHGTSLTKEGLNFNGKDNYIQSDAAVTGDYKTILLRFKPKEAITAASIGQTLYARADTNVQHVLIGDNGTATATILLYGLINKQTYIKDEFPVNEWIDLVLRWNGTSYDIWANGTQRTTYYVTAHMALLSGVQIDLSLMTSTGYGPFNGEISDFRVYSNAFTDAEIETLHNTFIRCTFHEDFSTEGADGVSKLPTGWMKSEGAFCINERVINLTEYVTDGYNIDATNWETVGAAMTFAGGKGVYDDSGNAQLAQAQANCPIYAGKRYTIYFTIAASGGSRFAITDYDVGTVYVTQTLYTNGSYALDFTTPAGTTGGLRFMAYTTGTSFTIEDISIKAEKKEISHYLEGVTLGYIYNQSAQAYGTWEFYINRTGAVAGIAFISDRQVGIQNGYSLSFLAGVPVLAKYVGGSPSDIAIGGSAITTDTWYKIKITRTEAGVFNVYIKGGAYGNVDYTVLFSNVTENTTKTSQNIIVVEDTGDKITNLDFYNGIKV